VSNARKSRKGRRNLNCPAYRECLDLAARERWPGWSCGRCRRRGERSREPENPAGYWRLLRAVFAPGPSRPKRKKAALTCAEIEALIDAAGQNERC
jgi:hypothetical protein